MQDAKGSFLCRREAPNPPDIKDTAKSLTNLRFSGTESRTNAAGKPVPETDNNPGFCWVISTSAFKHTRKQQQQALATHTDSK